MNAIFAMAPLGSISSWRASRAASWGAKTSLE